MRLFKMLNSLLIIFKINILKFLRTFKAYKTFFMYLLQMPPEFVNIVERFAYKNHMSDEKEPDHHFK